MFFVLIMKFLIPEQNTSKSKTNKKKQQLNLISVILKQNYP
jgi:hypothetical protein